ncbi:hypothetical protein MTO96_016449 [Rhipicephalus appendiculatus]
MLPWHRISDPLDCPSDECLHRVRREIIELCREGPTRGHYVQPLEEDMTKMHCIVSGPAGTPYEGTFLHLLVCYPPTYPALPPRIVNVTAESGTLTLHPSLPSSGLVKLNILKESGAGSWTASSSVKDVLVALQQELKSETTQANYERIRYLKETTVHEAIRVGVCENVEAWYGKATEIPKTLRQKVGLAFVSRFFFYIESLTFQAQLDGREMNPSLGGPAVFSFKGLLRRVLKLTKKSRQYCSRKVSSSRGSVFTPSGSLQKEIGLTPLRLCGRVHFSKCAVNHRRLGIPTN